jgi:AcrR family transcriptional regulator
MAAPTVLRADAARNRRRLLDAAARVFAERGLDAGVDEIAREAGVGVGTLYRRFPTKDDLIAAVFDDRFEPMEAALASAAEHEDPWYALESAMAAFAEAAILHRALLHRIAYSGYHAQAVHASKERVLAILDRLLVRAREAGVVREDLVARDLLALSGMMSRLPPWQLEQEPDIWRRYLGLMLDGLRPDGAHPLPHPPSQAVPPFTR